MDWAAAHAHFEAVDPVLHAATHGLTPRPWPARSPYEGLLRAVVGQQLSVKAAATIWGRVVARFDGVPAPAALIASEVEDLRALGLSRPKAGYVQGIATAARDGQLEAAELRRLDDDALRRRLVTLKGVGVWTAEILMMGSLGRPDVFPVGDLGLRTAVRRLHGLDEEGKALEARCAELASRWSPHRTAAAKLLWCWLDNAPDVDPA